MTVSTIVRSAESSPSSTVILTVLKSSDHLELENLLARGLDPNARVPVSDGSESLLVTACIYSDTQIVALLLGHGARADESSRTGTFGRSPVAIAMNRSKPDLIELLIRHGADAEGFTALMIAIMRGDVSAAEREINQGANIDALNRFGRSALDFAPPIAGCLELLLQHNAKHSFSSVEIATMLGDEALIRGHINGPLKQRDWRSEVRWAILYDRPEILNLIIQSVPGAGSDEYYFRTPAALSAELGRLACLRVLVQNGADIDRLSEELFTPMALAERNGRSECVRLLRAKRPDH
jgi:ankyrin repeat protein